MGGMLGGALCAYLLGPNFVRQPDGHLADRPPLKLLGP